LEVEVIIVLAVEKLSDEYSSLTFVMEPVEVQVILCVSPLPHDSPPLGTVKVSVVNILTVISTELSPEPVVFEQVNV